MKVVGNPTAKVPFKAASKANVTIPRDNETIGEDGVVKTYLISSPDSFMKVSLLLKFVALAPAVASCSLSSQKLKLDTSFQTFSKVEEC